MYHCMYIYVYSNIAYDCSLLPSLALSQESDKANRVPVSSQKLSTISGIQWLKFSWGYNMVYLIFRHPLT